MFEKEGRKERMLNLVKPKKNKERRGERHKETKKDIEEMKEGRGFYEGPADVPDVRFSVGSVLEAGHTLCGFPKAKQIQAGQPLSHRHIELHTATRRGGRARVFLFMWKKRREEGREE